MMPVEALLELLARVGANQGAPILVSEKELASWPTAAVGALKFQKLLVPASPAASVVCSGCEQECVMPVHNLPTEKRSASSFVVCDKREDTNRVPVPVEQLRQWQCGAEEVTRFVALSLGLRPGSPRKTTEGLWGLGLVRGKRRSQMLCLRANGDLELVAGNHEVPLAELVRFGPASYAVDIEAIRLLVDASTTGDPRYTPRNAKRETRKMATQEMYKSWQKAYRASKKKRPDRPDVWYSLQIAKMECAVGRDAATIKKHMK